MAVKNVVFDIGNVLVTWNPYNIIRKTLPDLNDPAPLIQKIFKTGFWYDLNAGKMSESEAIEKYHPQLEIKSNELKILMSDVKESLTPLEDSISLVQKLHAAHYPLYIITDNTKEIMQFLLNKYDFWHLFKGIVSSADIGHLKPSPKIYQHLLSTYHLVPEETIFFDDLLENVEGARFMKMHSFQFTNAQKCIEDLKNVGIQVL